jgi:hypothetical protein
MCVKDSILRFSLFQIIYEFSHAGMFRVGGNDIFAVNTVLSSEFFEEVEEPDDYSPFASLKRFDTPECVRNN